MHIVKSNRMNSNRTIYSGFIRSSELFSERASLEVEGKVLTYGELGNKAASIAATLNKRFVDEKSSLTAVFASRSVTAYTGMLGTLLSGNGYVALSHNTPTERLRFMLEKTDARSMIVDNRSAKYLDKVLDGFDNPLLIILPEVEIDDLSKRFPQHTFIGPSDLEPPESWEERTSSPDSTACILFTSGSTGTPKAVMITHRNITTYIDFIINRYDIKYVDRFSQFCELTWDTSLLEIFAAWKKGACVCCPSYKDVINPTNFIIKSKLTFVFLVPSNVAFMKKHGLLKPNKFPLVRFTNIGGEVLTADLVNAWTVAAPNSVVDNGYGPTELSVGCLIYRWNPALSPSKCKNGVLPIGTPYTGLNVLVVDEELKELPQGERGELLVTGAHLSPGYLGDPDKTKKGFIVPPGKNTIYYRTGDLVLQSPEDGLFHYLGRNDNQVKIYGMRIELGEIESVLRIEAETDRAVAVGWPITSTGVGGIVAFLENPNKSLDKIRKGVKTRLPGYMVPHDFHILQKFPLNRNRKIDRKALIELLKKNQNS